MKYFLIAFMALWQINSSAQKGKNFEIIGSINGLKEGTIVYLKHNTDEGPAEIIDSVRSNNGSFYFKGKLLLEGECYFIKIDTVRTHYDFKIESYITIAMENKKITVKGFINDLGNCVVKGSKTNDERLGFNRESDAIIKQVNNLWKTLDKTRDTTSAKVILAKIDSFNNVRYPNYVKDWIHSHPSSMWSAWLTLNLVTDFNDKKVLYGKLSKESKNSKYGLLLQNELNIWENTSVGKTAPGFEFPDTSGKIVSLKDVQKTGKLVLIDFWASWCGPCRRSFSHLRQLHERYGNNGLVILGYSVDENPKFWKEAIIDEQINWVNIRETDKTTASKLYGVQRLPTTFLINNDGKIVARDLNEEKLEEKIEELLGKKEE